MRCLAAATLLFAALPAAAAQSWPQRPVKLVVPFAAGGNIDGVARLIAQPLGTAFHEQVLVEARPGANGTIAGEYVAHAPADGYTLFMATTAQIAVAPAISKIPYDPVADFAPICGVTSNPFVLSVHRSVPSTTLKAFVDYVKAHPGQLSFGSGGVGSLSHLASALFLSRAGLDMVHVVYKGGAPALVDLLAGHVQMYSANVSEVIPHAHSSDIHLVAVSGPARSPQLPDVPTIAESGYPGFRAVTWSGILAPAHTPPQVIDAIAAACVRAVRDAAFQARLASFGVEATADGPEALARRIKADLPFWAEQVKLAGVQRNP